MSRSLPTSASVVVIGGGAMGSSTLYHLAALGFDQPVLLERDQLTSGTSWHSAAQVRALRSTENLTRLIQYSAALYQRLEAETGQSTGWNQTGSLSIATHADRLTHIKRQTSLAHLFGLEAEIISGSEAGRLWPLMRTDDIVGAAWSPSDGRVNPSDLCAALIKGARANGALVFEHTPVTGLRLENGRVAGVETPSGSIECGKVVVCAGLWSRAIALLGGAHAPLHACEHYYLLTQPIEGIDGHLPTLGDHDAHLYLRDDVGGLLVGSFEPNAKPIGIEALPEGFSFDLLEEDWEHFEPMLVNAMHRVPALESAETRMLLNGPESFTPDGGFLLGESPDLPGLFLGCGMNSMGLASSGGAGWALASWVAEGRPAFDLSAVDIRRFSPLQNSLAYVRARSAEVLSLHYALDYPGREHESGRDLRRTPVHERLLAAGAVYGERGGWERPSWFRGESPVDETLVFGAPGWEENVNTEQLAARNGVALFDQSTFGKISVAGPDAEAVLNRLCANDMDVPPGRCVYTAMLNERGGIESDFTVLRLEQNVYLIVTGTTQVTRDLAWLRRHISSDDRVVFSDVTSGWAVLGVAGPGSRALLEQVSTASFSNEAFPYFTWQTVDIGEATVRAVRISYSGELGWELQVPADLALGVYDALLDAGAAHGLKLAGTFAMTALRIERGFRAWGHDLTPDDSPYEAGIGFAVRSQKSIPFLGQAALSEARERALHRRLCFFVLEDAAVRAQGGEPILCRGEYVGQVTSAAYGATVGRCVALGYIRAPDRPIEDVVAGGGFEVEVACERFAVGASITSPLTDRGIRS